MGWGCLHGNSRSSLVQRGTDAVFVGHAWRVETFSTLGANDHMSARRKCNVTFQRKLGPLRIMSSNITNKHKLTVVVIL